jgi:hypothetical protein
MGGSVGGSHGARSGQLAIAESSNAATVMGAVCTHRCGRKYLGAYAVQNRSIIGIGILILILILPRLLLLLLLLLIFVTHLPPATLFQHKHLLPTMAANTASAATTPTSPVAFAHQQQQIFVSPSTNRRQSVRPGPRTDAATVPASATSAAPAAAGTNGISGSPSSASSSPNILDPPPGLSYAEFVAQWHDPHIARWLTDNKCAQYIQAFRDNDIRGDIILELDMDTLKEIGLVSVGDRTRIRNAIKLLRQRCQRPSTGPTLLLNGSPNDVKFSSAAGLKLNGDAATATVQRSDRVLSNRRSWSIVDSSPSDLPLCRSKMSVPGTSPASSAVAAATPKAPTQPVALPHLASPNHLPSVRSHASPNPHAVPNIPPAPKGPPPMPPGGSKNAPLDCRYPPRHFGALELLHRTVPLHPHGRAIPCRPNHPHPPLPGPKSTASREASHLATSQVAPLQRVPRPPNPRGVRSPVIAHHQKQSSFGSATRERPAGRLGAGGATTPIPYAANAGMGIVPQRSHARPGELYKRLRHGLVRAQLWVQRWPWTVSTTWAECTFDDDHRL